MAQIRPSRIAFRTGLLALVLQCAGCAPEPGALTVAVVGTAPASDPAPDSLPESAFPLYAATHAGLVGFDAEGHTAPALAERWIVTADGLSYIFRLGNGGWSGWGGARANKAQLVAQALRRTIAAQAGTPLGRDLSGITAIRAMAERVVEIDLAAPQPDLLTLLAQPELGLAPPPSANVARGALVTRADADGLLLLPPRAGPAPQARPLRLLFRPADRAVAAFKAGSVDLVMGGTIDTLPIAASARFVGATLQLDPVGGLYGLAVERAEGFLAEAPEREALALAIDREALVARIAIDDWQPTTRLVAHGLEGDDGSVGERWVGMPMAQRRAQAAQRVARWRRRNGTTPVLRLAMPAGPGSQAVLAQLTADMAAVGITLQPLPASAGQADLRLVDRVARYPRAAWFLNQLACAPRLPACNPAGDGLVLQALREADPLRRSQLLAQAEIEITAANGFIPLARPVRWMMARGLTGAFAPVPWGWHPLLPLLQRAG